MIRFTANRLPAVVAGILLGSTVMAQEPSAFTESVVIFNTICAKCHEGECSGRMSFEQAFEASISHINRHYGPASGKTWLHEELFVILNHMKERCAYYPMPVPIPPQREWHADLLDKMSTLLERNYFVPLGPLDAGTYRIELDLRTDGRLSVQLVSEGFDTLVEECYESTGGRIEFPVSIAAPGNHYIRTRPREPLQIVRMAIVPLEPPRD